MVEFKTHPREYKPDGSWRRDVEVDGVRFRVEMIRTVIPSPNAWRKPSVRWTSTISSLPDNSVRHHGHVHPDTPIRRLFRIAGLVCMAECGCEVSIWHYNQDAKMCDVCADREAAMHEMACIADGPEADLEPAGR